MKKILTVLLVLILGISLAGCGAKTDDAAAPADDDFSKKAALIVQVGGLGDEGFNDDCYAGMVKAKEEYGVDFVCVEPVSADQTDEYLRQLGEAGYGLVICMEYGALSFVYDVAPLYPDTQFVSFGATENDIPNLHGLMAETWNSSYLGGALAAFAATDGNEIIDGVANQPGCKLGVVFAIESSGFYLYEDAFKQGARAINPDCEVIVSYEGTFDDAANVKNITENMIKSDGCDIVWLCTGTAGLGGLQAARLNNALAIGVDSNQDKIEEGSILTSILMNNGTAIHNLIGAWKDGNLDSMLDENGDFVEKFEKDECGVTDLSVIGSYVTNQENFDKLLALKEQVTKEINDGTAKVWNVLKQDGARYPY